MQVMKVGELKGIQNPELGSLQFMSSKTGGLNL